MRIDCPHCGRQGNLRDGVALPSTVRCPGCQNKFEPIPYTPAVAVATASPATKECHYCGEQVLVVAKKCRHCGEILDVALRAAEEAKTIARSNQPLVINNNVSSSAAASAVAGGAIARASLLRSFIRFLVISFSLIFFGIVFTASGAHEFGAVLGIIGFLLLMVGVPIFMLRGVWHILFG